MSTPLTNCPSCGAPLDRTATACGRCGTPIIKSGGEQTSQVLHNIAVAGTEMKSTTAAMWANLSLLFCWPLISIIIYFSKKDDPFVLAHLKSTTNFGITMFIAALVSLILMLVAIGFVLIFAVAIVVIIFSIKGAQAASRGELYTYPLSIKLFS